MKKLTQKQKLALLIALVVLAFAAAALAYYQLTKDYTPRAVAEEGKEAPNFTVYDQSGEAVELKDFAGKPVVVNCWASWCMPCQVEMPDFQAAFETDGDEIQFLMVDMPYGGNDDPAAARTLVEVSGYTFPVYFDTEGSLAITYGVTAMPTSFFIDAEGKLAGQFRGMLDEQLLQEYMDLIR